MTSELRMAVTAWKFGTAGELAEQGRIAESMGFHSFWLPENHFGDDHAIPAPLMLLAAVASQTSRIGLGSTSYLLPIRHPIQAAEEVAVLDRISDGRVFLGVGRGFQTALFSAFDVPARDKRKQFRNNLEMMMRAWRGEAIAYDEGEPVFLAPLPVQRPHPPVWVAAFGPLAIKQAGSLGLPYLASPVETMDTLMENYSRHRMFLEESGHARPAATPVMRTLFVSDNPRLARQARDNLGEEAAHRMREPGAAPDHWAIIGDTAYVRDKLAEYAETLDLTHMIARGRIPGLEEADQIRSLELLASLTTELQPSVPAVNRQS